MSFVVFYYFLFDTLIDIEAFKIVIGDDHILSCWILIIVKLLLASINFCPQNQNSEQLFPKLSLRKLLHSNDSKFTINKFGRHRGYCGDITIRHRSLIALTQKIMKVELRASMMVSMILLFYHSFCHMVINNVIFVLGGSEASGELSVSYISYIILR